MDDPSSTESPSELVSSSRDSRLTLKWVGSAWLLFALFLISLAMLTANPVLINKQQVQNSEIVIHGIVEEVRSDSVRFRVVDVLLGQLDQEQIVVDRFGTKKVSKGEEWVVPIVSISPDEFYLTPLNAGTEQQMGGIIYRADPESLNILESLLSSEDISP